MTAAASPTQPFPHSLREEEVSIVMPAYNAARTIDASIASVLSQTYPHWVLHVVDDGSSDETAAIVANLAERDRRIRLHRPGRLGGSGAARNHAISHAAGRYLAFLDADDLWLPHKLAHQVAALQKGRAMAICSAYHVSADSGRTLASVRTPPSQISRRQMLASNKVGCLTMLIDRRRAGDVRMPMGVTHEDYVAWLGLFTDPSSCIEGLQEPLAIYCVHPDSRSGNKLRAAGAQWHVYRVLLGMAAPRAAFWMIQYAVATGTRTLLERLAFSRKG